MSFAVLMSVLALAGPDPDGVVATAPATAADLTAEAAPVAPSAEGAAQQAAEAHNLSTEQQIERWLSDAPKSASEPFAEAAPVDDRKPHGFVDVGVGTGGYRSYGGGVSLPIGESGRLDLTYSQVENGYGTYPYGYVDPYFADGGYAFSGAMRPGRSLDYERKVARPDGPPQLRRRGAVTASE